MPTRLTRVLEPEVMDSLEEARDYDSMDHQAVNTVFVSDFLDILPSPTGTVLDVGTGTARIPIELCSRASGFEVIAIDAAEHMLALGHQNVANAGLNNRIRLVRTDAKRLPYPNMAFEAVISNSIIHHIPDPFEAMSEMVRVCRKGGVVFIRDLFRPENETELRRIVDTYAAGADEHQRKMFGDSLNAALTVAEVQSLASQLGFNPKTVRQTSDRHWTWAAQVE